MMRTALILAGGKAARLHREKKAFILLKGKPLLQWVIEAVAPCVHEVILSGDCDLGQFGYPVVKDHVSNGGPLAGFHAGFSVIHSEYTFVTGCDMPFINPKVIHFLFENAKGYSCCLPRENEFTEPLCCVYNTEDVTACFKVMEKGKRIWDLIQCLPNPRYVPFAHIKKVDAHLLSFKNINTFEDLENAETLLSEGVIL